MFNVHNSLKNLTRVISSLELAEIMNSPGSIDDFSYIGLLFFKNGNELHPFLYLCSCINIGNGKVSKNTQDNHFNAFKNKTAQDIKGFIEKANLTEIKNR